MTEVTKELCDERHADLMRGINALQADVKTVLAIIAGNGKPGLRQTQAEVEMLRADVEEILASRKEWLLLFARPVLTALIGGAGGLFVFLLSLYFG